MIEQLIFSEEYTTLNKIYDGDTPNHNEQIWEFVDLEDFDTEFKLVEINPVSVWNSWKPDGETLMKDVFNFHASKQQKEYIAKLRKKAKQLARETIVVINLENKMLIDGNHRIAALALEGISLVKAIDINQPFLS